jgi:hypothetical protein
VIALWLLLMTWLPLAGAADAPTPDGTAAVEHHISQAELFLKKNWYADARRELESAIALELGRGSFTAYWLLAQVCYELLDAESAGRYARVAAGLAKDPGQAAAATELSDALDRVFGVLVIDGPYAGMASLLQLERESTLLDPELKKFVDRVALLLRKRNALPVRIALPAGDYLVNGHRATVNAGRDTRLVLPMNALGSRGFAALQVSRLELSTGTGLFLSDRVDNLRPGLDIQLAVTQPIRGWLVGAMVDYSVRSYVVDGIGPRVNPSAFTVGARVGRELMIGGPLAFRPSVGYRFGYVPGIPFDCFEGTGPTYSCADPRETGRKEVDAQVYAVGRAHIPFVELAVDWRRAGRTTAAGLGVKIAIEEALGTVPTPAQATVLSDGTNIRYETTAPRWSATGFRMLTNFSFAF